MSVRKIALGNLYHPTEPPRTMSISMAVSAHINRHAFAGGSLERIQEHTDTLEHLLGDVIERLHDRGILDEAAILDILGSSFSFVEEDH